MSNTRRYFLCGIGGSGMLPLAMILKAAGHAVDGSDRALDQGRTAPKFDFLRKAGVGLFPQDGSGVVGADQILVRSAAVEDTVADVVAAKRVGAADMQRAALLAELFNAAPVAIGVAGTSGKSTTTAMIAWILHAAGKAPTVMNGAVMKNFVSPDTPFASALVGRGEIFVSEVDESDGSIAMFSPSIAVLNNISLDHKSMEELRRLFGGFVDKAQRAVLNLDNPETAALARGPAAAIAATYGVADAGADYTAEAIEPRPFGVSFDAVKCEGGARVRVDLKMPGRHNVSNALAAIAACCAAGVSFENAAGALFSFEGVRRRLEFVGEAAGVTVIDDFAHNPDKIAASLTTLRESPGRLLVMFQPHGFGPLAKMRREFAACFADNLGADDMLAMPEPVYFGGTVAREVTSADLAGDIRKAGRAARAFANREACGEALVARAAPGDRIVIMGARDDTLSEFAAALVEKLKSSENSSRMSVNP